MLVRILSALIIVITVASVWLWNEYNLAMSTPVIFNEAKIIEINKGDSFSRITRKLRKKDIKIKPRWFKAIAYKNGVAKKLKAGEYELKPGLTMPDILALFVEGKSRQYSITFPEGWSFKQLVQEIQNNPHLRQTLDVIDNKTLMSQLGSDYEHPEGLFFPDTYFFDKNATDFSILKTAYQKMQLILQSEWQQKEKDLPIDSAYQALILASIIEKETGAAIERPQIAGVFTRRLRKGMLLQTDPTVIYGMGERYNGNIRRKDLREKTVYNTYVIKGLPPTPIAMPGKAAINAALHPAKGKTLYFVAMGQGAGTHVFSATLREHNNAVNKYQRRR